MVRAGMLSSRQSSRMPAARKENEDCGRAANKASGGALPVRELIGSIRLEYGLSPPGAVHQADGFCVVNAQFFQCDAVSLESAP